MKIKSINSSKTVEVLKKMDEKEWRYFVKWIASPWCNSTKKLVDLLAILQKSYPKFDNPKLTREKVFQKLYKGKKFSSGVMDNLFSELNIQAERFLTFQEFEKSKHQKKLFLAQAFQEKGIENRFLNINKSAIQDLEKQPTKEWEDNITFTLLKQQLFQHLNQSLLNLKESNALLSEMDRNLETTYLLQKATNINAKIFRTRILKNANFEVKKDIKNWLSMADGIAHPSINLFRQRFQYNENNLLNQYFNLKEDLLSNFELLNKMEQQVHLLSLINDASDLRKKGFIDLSDTLPLFKLGLSSRILIEKNILNPGIYVMIISASNLVKDFEFTEHFIQTYSKHLPQKAKEDGIHYALAHIANKKNELDRCLEIMSKHDFKHHYFQWSTKILMIQTLFESTLSGNTDQFTFFSKCDAFEQWLRRDKVRSHTNKESVINFVQKSRALLRLYLEPDFDEAAIRKVLEGKINVQPINWLYDKRDEIIQLRKNGRSPVAR